MQKIIDLRSDTVTQPTPQMRDAMRDAVVGDDGYRDDPTVNRLEEIAASRVGKEAAMFVPSGTMGNLISILSHTSHGDEIIAEQKAHIVQSEMAGAAAVAGCLVRGVTGLRGVMDPQSVEEILRPRGSRPRTGSLCVENTHNSAGGVVIPLDNLTALRRVCEPRGVPIHMDGARVFNAAAALKVDVKDITRHVDSVMFCLSKGLGAPMGSIVAGTTQFITKARQARKMLGGTLRQAGIVAAAGIVALETMVDRLDDDHQNARALAEGLSRSGLAVDVSLVDTNLVFVPPPAGMSAEHLAARFAGLGVACKANGNRVRMVTHHQVTRADIQEVISRFQTAVLSDQISFA